MNAAAPRVVVVLCSWRGTAYLAEQLDSIGAQTYPVAVHVHDDASGDGTAELARRHPAVTRTVAHETNVGHVANFERALGEALASGATHIAFADQDDLWHPERIARGMAAMAALEARHGGDTPLLVHSDLRMIEADGRLYAPSFLAWRGYAIDRRRDVATMLGQCGVMGNTCLVNRALGALALPFPEGLHVHDWWLGLLAELHGARDLLSEPLVDYRIHAANASNSRDALDGGAGRATLRRALARDFRLPFMEDTRLSVIEALLEGDARRRVTDPTARRLLTRFRAYLRLEGSRAVLLWRLFADGLPKRAWRTRLRTALALLLTRRYGGSARR